MKTPQCVYCPRVPAEYAGCRTGRPICAKHACAECKTLPSTTHVSPEERTVKLFGCHE